jgi:dTDP-4-dehydrorhamnose 3,5-epimerase
VIFRDTGLAGLVLVEVETVVDERGSFARTFDAAAWEAREMPAHVEQCNVSRNAVRGTLRGLHYQAAPYHEAKLVRCAAGSIFDVAVDLRSDSPTFCRWFGQELSPENGRMLFIPEGFAHGFVTLTDAAEVVYQMSAAYEASAARGVRWNDPAFDIEWPIEPVVLSDRDRGYPDFRP